MFSVKETNYKTLRIPYGKTKINGEFNYISGIDTVIIPASVTEISASFQFSSVKKVIFETRMEDGKVIGVQRITNYSFDNSALEELDLPASVEEVTASFQSCFDLKKVNFGVNSNTEKKQGLQKLGDYSFNCTSLEKINFPQTLSENRAKFYACPNLKSINGNPVEVNSYAESIPNFLQSFKNPDKFNTLIGQMTNVDWYCLISGLNISNLIDREIKSELFFTEKFDLLANNLNGDDWVNFIIRLLIQNDLDKKIKESLFFDLDKFTVLANTLSGSNWVDIIIRLNINNALDSRIKNELFFNPEKLNILLTTLSPEDWVIIIIRLNINNVLDNRIKNKLNNKLEKYSIIETALNRLVTQTEIVLTNEAEIYPILDDIYYKSNISLDSRKLLMIQKATEIIGDKAIAYNLVTKRYSFNIRKVDIRNKSK